MEKRIVVPVTLQKDARLLDLDVDVELEVNCSLSHQMAPPPAPAAPPTVPEEAIGTEAAPEMTEAPAFEPPPEDQTMALSKAILDQTRSALTRPLDEASGAKPTAFKPAARTGKSTKPAPKSTRSAESRSKSSKTKIDNVLDELLKKKAPRK